MSLVSDSASSVPIPKRVALITPVRDERGYIEAMLESISNQDVPPVKWIIVDDGSTDGTQDVVNDYVQKYSFIHLLQLPPRQERRPGGESAISHALAFLNLAEYDFIARFDADLIFERDYIARMLHEFSLDSTLGIAGGGLYIQRETSQQLENVPGYHVRGALKMYRRECFVQIGGLTDRIGWDTIDEVSAWMKGWKTRSFFQYRVIHRRPTGEGLKASRIWWERGKAEYFTWSHPLFVMVKAIKVGRESRSVSAPASFLSGFACSYVRRYSRVRDRVFVTTRRRQQLGRMSAMLGAPNRMPVQAPTRPGTDFNEPSSSIGN